MKNKLFFLFIILSSFSFAQEEIRPFSNPTRTTPRFKNDVNLSEKENTKSFKKRIQNHFSKNFKIEKQDFEIIKESKCFLTFSIDTLGKATYKNVKVLKKEYKTSEKFIEESKRVINLLPLLIPATQRGNPVKIIYYVPVTNKFFRIK